MKLLTILLTLTLLGGCAMAPHGAVREAGYGGTQSDHRHDRAAEETLGGR